MQKYPVNGHEASLLPEGEWELAWHDEFDGTVLDRTKWDYRLSMMGKRHPAWTDKGVHLDGQGNAVFSILEEDGRPVSSQLQTGYNFMDEPCVPTKFGNDDALQWKIGKLRNCLHTHKYGYYECRCKMQQNPEAWWSAFWIQSPIIGASLDAAETGSEIDIMEYFDRGKAHPHCVYTGGYGQDCKKAKVGREPDLDTNAFHRFGMLWNESGYTFYVDGNEDGHIGQYVSRRPEFILLTTEVKGYRKGAQLPVKEAFDCIGKDAFVVDYVRVFDAIK